MFKKTIFIFLTIILLLISLPIVCKSTEEEIVYLEVGSNIDKVIEIKDCMIISGKVDSNIEGEYVVTYFHNTFKYYFKKRYIVVGSSSFEKGIITYQDYFSCEYEKNPSMIIKDEESIIIGSYYYDHSKLNSLNDKMAYISIYDGKSTKASIWFSYYSEIVKLVYTKAGFIVLMNYDDNGKTHLQLLEYNLDGELLRRFNFASNNNDYGKNILIKDDYIYLIANSSSSIPPFVSIYNGISTAMIIKINYYTFKDENYISFGNNVSNNILDSFLVDDNLYIIFKPFGSGAFFKKVSASMFLVKYDLDLKQDKYLEIGNDDYYGSSIINNHIFIFTSSLPVTQKILFNEYDLDLLFMGSEEYYFPKDDYKITKIISSGDAESKILAIKISPISLSKLSYLGEMVFEGDHFIYHEHFIEDYDLVNIYQDDDIYLMGYKNNNIVIYKYYFFKEDEGYFVNQKEVRREIVFNEYEEDNIYGNNEIISFIKEGNITYVKDDMGFVKMDASIYDGETYERGIKIWANGVMYLNDKRIENNHIIFDKGEYLLKVYGKDNIVSYIEFSVDDIACIAEESSIIKTPIATISDISYNNIFNSEDTIKKVNYVSQESPSEFKTFGIGVIIIAFGIMVGVIIPIKGRKK